jgi:hypothetical protein
VQETQKGPEVTTGRRSCADPLNAWLRSAVRLWVAENDAEYD